MFSQQDLAFECCNDIACNDVFVYQTTEAGREREALHGAAKEEDGERCSENDEERAEDSCQALVTFEECSVLSPRNEKGH